MNLAIFLYVLPANYVSWICKVDLTLPLEVCTIVSKLSISALWSQCNEDTTKFLYLINHSNSNKNVIFLLQKKNTKNVGIPAAKKIYCLARIWQIKWLSLIWPLTVLLRMRKLIIILCHHSLHYHCSLNMYIPFMIRNYGCECVWYRWIVQYDIYAT